MHGQVSVIAANGGFVHVAKVGALGDFLLSILVRRPIQESVAGAMNVSPLSGQSVSGWRLPSA
jgi:hypothetical protein